MNIRQLFEQRRPTISSSGGLADVFGVVYGRKPHADEAETLNRLNVDLQNQTVAFRAVIGNFDHQFRPTPFAVRLTRTDISFVQVAEGFSLAVDTADASVSAHLLAGMPYEPHLVSFFKERIKPGMVVIDVGANMGFHTMLAARLVGESGKVISFEPNSENCRLLLLSLSENQFRQVELYPVAASNRQGHALFTTHVGSNGGLLPSTEEVLHRPSCVVVPTFRLDDLVKERVDFMKLDTEGAEGLVIGGAKTLIEKYRPTIVCEFSMEMLPRVSGITGAEYLTYFQALGYDLHILDKQQGDLLPIADIISFLDDYGPETRIEDLAFIPQQPK
jgi:FkbM family methyltransferase